METIRIIYQNLGIKNLVTNAKASCKSSPLIIQLTNAPTNRIMTYISHGARWYTLRHLSFVKYQNQQSNEDFDSLSLLKLSRKKTYNFDTITPHAQKSL